MGNNLNEILLLSNKDINFFSRKDRMKNYKIIKIRKNNGDYRIVYEPLELIKLTQKRIARLILEKIEISNNAMAYRKNNDFLQFGIRANAQKHISREYILRLDIKKFFDNIRFKAVQKIFLDIGKTEYEATILTRLCTIRGENGIEFVPQGTVTAPLISNIFLKNFDTQLVNWLVNRDIIYSRYCDDLIFSFNDIALSEKIEKYVSDLLGLYGLYLNNSKRKIMNKSNQKITGIVIENDTLKVSRKFKRVLRAKIHLYYTNSEEIQNSSLCDSIIGKISFVNYIEPEYIQKLYTYMFGLSKLNRNNNNDVLLAYLENLLKRRD